MNQDGGGGGSDGEEDAVNPLPIIIDRRRPVLTNPHRKRSATVSTRPSVQAKNCENQAKSITIPTMFVWECAKSGTSSRKISGIFFSF